MGGGSQRPGPYDRNDRMGGGGGMGNNNNMNSGGMNNGGMNQGMGGGGGGPIRGLNGPRGRMRRGGN